MRIKFSKGRQREFLQDVLNKTGCFSLRELSRRLDINYSSLKNYFNESRTLSQTLFEDLCFISKINKSSLNFEILNENWGNVKGGKCKTPTVS